MQKRYALASTRDTAAGLVWSTGGVWSAGTPDEAKLMTGPQVDAFAARHPGAVIVDVLVYLDMAKVWNAAHRAAINRDAPSTPESRAAAREAGRLALRAAGYVLAAAKANPFNPCEA